MSFYYSNSLGHELFISTVKVLLNVLHHGSGIVIEILFKTSTMMGSDTHAYSQTDTHSCSQTDTHSCTDNILEWPPLFDSNNRTEWMKDKLQVTMNVSDQILQNGISIANHH